MSDIRINTIPESDIFENTYKYPDWYNKKKYIFYNKMLARLKKLSYIHTRASQYYDKMNYYIFGPSITLTAISGIASFLSTSAFVDDNTQNSFGVAVGVIASISSVMQSIGGACQFSAKQEGHRSAAEQYNNLIVKTKFEIEMPNEENYADDLEKMILDIQGKCNFFPPQFIVDEYEKKQKAKHIPIENTKSSQKKRLNKNYETFTQGTSIDDFSLQNTHDAFSQVYEKVDDEIVNNNLNNIKIKIKDNIPTETRININRVSPFEDAEDAEDAENNDAENNDAENNNANNNNANNNNQNNDSSTSVV